MNVRIVIVDNDAIFRDGMKSLLIEEPGINVVGEAGSGLTAVSVADIKQPDVILMNASLPDISGVEATRKITFANPHIKVIALSTHSDKEWIVRMFMAGASGYMSKECEFVEILRAIKTVMNDKLYLAPDMSDEVVKDYFELGRKSPKFNSSLTKREKNILQLISDGCTSKEIARYLGISLKIVTHCRKRLMEKLDIHSIAGLTRFAIINGFTTVDD